MTQNPVAIVTGASKGIGRAVALNFAKLGYDVALIARSKDLLDALADEIRSTYKTRVAVFAMDISDQKKVRHTVETVIKTHDRIDVLFNCAGALFPGTSTIGIEDLNVLIDINIRGVYYFVHAVAPQMKKQRSGYIMNVSSMAAIRALAGTGAYALTKGAISRFSEALFDEMLDYNIKVTTLCPSVVATDMTSCLADYPDKDKIQPDDIAATVNYLLALSPSATLKEIQILNPALEIRSRIPLDFKE